MTESGRITISTSNNSALFQNSVDKNYTQQNYTIDANAGASSFTFDVLWAKESSNVSLIAQSSWGAISVYASLDGINIKIGGISIQGPSQINIGETVEFTANYHLINAAHKAIWEYDQNIFTLVNESKSSTQYKLKLQSKQSGTTSVNLKIEESRPLPMIVRKGSHNIQVKIPWDIVPPPGLICINEQMAIRLSGLEKIPGATIQWRVSDSNSSLVSGQGTGSATFEGKGNGYTRIFVTVTYLGISESKNVQMWVGIPIVNESSKSYEMQEREQIQLKAGEFTGIYTKENCRWELLSGKCIFVNINDEVLDLKSTAKARENDTINIKATILNKCGEVSVLHTIYVSALKGTSFEDPIDLGTLKSSDWEIEEVKDTRLFDNNLGTSANEIYYKFTTSQEMNVFFDAEDLNIHLNFKNVYIIDSSYNIIDKESIQDPYFDMLVLPPGTYYLAIEGEDEDDNGEFIIDLSFRIRGLHYDQATFIGSFDNAFTFTDTRNTGGTFYQSNYSYIENGEWKTPSPNGREIYYTLELKEPMNLIVHNADTEITATRIHIMRYDRFGSYLTKYNPLISVFGQTDYPKVYADPDISEELKRKLYPARAYAKTSSLKPGIITPGIYCIVTEGEKVSNTSKDNGPVTITIEGIPLTDDEMEKYINATSNNVEPNKDNVIIYPNPNDGNFTFEISESIDEYGVFYVIIDMTTGITIKKNHISSSVTNVDISNYRAGYYILQIYNNRKVSSHKILKNQ